MFESLKGWIIDPNTQAQKTIENYENQRLSIEDAIESGLLNNRAGQIFLDYGDVIMGPPVTLPSSLVGIREAIKGNFDSKEMQRTATAGFYAGFVGQGIEYTQIISNADYQLSMIITSAKGVNSINNPLSYLLFIKDFSLTQTIDAAKAGLQDVWNGTYDSAIGRKIGAGTFNYLLMTIGGAQLKGKGTACKAVESGSNTVYSYDGVKQASEYLQSQGVPRAYRKQILESFDVETIKLQTAGESTYGLRFYGGNANAEGRYLFETFSPLTNRQNLALPYEWNSMTGIQQFQIRKGTTMITGKAVAQKSFGSQYIGGANQWYINNFEDLIKCR